MKTLNSRLVTLFGLAIAAGALHAAPKVIPKDFSITDEENAAVMQELYQSKFQTPVYMNRMRDIDKIIGHLRTKQDPEIEKMVVTNPELAPGECGRKNARGSYDLDDGTPGSMERNLADPLNDVSCGRLLACVTICVNGAGQEGNLNSCDKALKEAACYKGSPYQNTEFTYQQVVWWGLLRNPTMMFASAYGKSPYKRKTKTVYPPKK